MQRNHHRYIFDLKLLSLQRQRHHRLVKHYRINNNNYNNNNSTTFRCCQRFDLLESVCHSQSLLQPKRHYHQLQQQQQQLQLQQQCSYPSISQASLKRQSLSFLSNHFVSSLTTQQQQQQQQQQKDQSQQQHLHLDSHSTSKMDDDNNNITTKQEKISSYHSASDYRDRNTSTKDNNNNMSASSSSSLVLLDDNPCWGSSTECDLSDLLLKIQKETIIRYESDNYIILSKPPDLRMDGPYKATVHKLLTYWYPSKSLMEQIISSNNNNDNDNNNNNCNDTSSNDTNIKIHDNDKNSETKTTNENLNLHQHHQQQQDKVLLNLISTLHVHNSLDDNELRPCHQLDYATSGILCVARNREAANFAIQQWEDRNVTKTYLAIVHGDLLSSLHKHKYKSNDTNNINNNDNNNNDEKWPILSQHEMTTKIRQLEDSYRAMKRRLKNTTKPTTTTFMGYQPSHALFQKYKSILRSSISSMTTKNINTNANTNTTNATKNNNNNNNNNNKKRKRSLLSDAEWEQVWEPVEQAIQQLASSQDNDVTCITKDIQSFLLKSSWKQICSDTSQYNKNKNSNNNNNNTNKQYSSFQQAFEKAADIHNGILRRQQEETTLQEQESYTLPTIFIVQNNDKDDNYNSHSNNEDDKPNHDNCHTAITKTSTDIYIYCPLAQLRDEFAMKIPYDIAQKYPQLKSLAGPPPDTSTSTSTAGDDAIVDKNDNDNIIVDTTDTNPTGIKSTTKKKNNDNDTATTNNKSSIITPLDFKPSLTKCTILETANYQGETVTKVKLWPITGRRHQLRVHTALLGHAILGDNTYSGSSNSSSSTSTSTPKNGTTTNNNQDLELQEEQQRTYPRMCLHAYSLRLKLLESSSSPKNNNDNNSNNNNNNTSNNNNEEKCQSNNGKQSSYNENNNDYKNNNKEKDSMSEITTIDPFVVKDGNLLLTCL